MQPSEKLHSRVTIRVEVTTTVRCGSVDGRCSAALTCSERNVSLVNTKLPVAALQQSLPVPSGVLLHSAHTAVC